MVTMETLRLSWSTTRRYIPLSLLARVHPLRATRSLTFLLFCSQTASYEYMRVRLTKSVHTFVSRHAINIDDCFGRIFLAIF